MTRMQLGCQNMCYKRDMLFRLSNVLIPGVALSTPVQLFAVLKGYSHVISAYLVKFGITRSQPLLATNCTGVIFEEGSHADVGINPPRKRTIVLIVFGDPWIKPHQVLHNGFSDL